jgi:hypothetical protein
MRGIVGFRFCAEVSCTGRRWGCSSKAKGRAVSKVSARKTRQHAIELMGEFEGFSSVAAMSGRGWQGDGLGAQGDGVIGGDDPLVAQAEAAGEVEAARQGAEVVRGIGSGTGEAQVVVDAEEGEHGVGLWQRGSTGEAEFADQPVLASAPGTFDAAFGLGRVGGDLLDAEFLQGTAELGGSLFSGELFGECPVGVVALKDGVAIVVEAGERRGQ